ncbi:hypothetical protein ACHAQA_004949 [Verticillium albo-atrum]
MEYQEPLDPAANQVRLIAIHDDAVIRDTISCTLRTVSLNDWAQPYLAFHATLAESTPHHAARGKWREHSSQLDGVDAPLRPRFAWGDYETLSYVWGSTLGSHTIIINEQPCAIGETLYQALVQFRRNGWYSPASQRMLWVDAISINQNDDVEKATEVQRMKSIYSLSEQSVVWLGPTLDVPDMTDEEYFVELREVLNSEAEALRVQAERLDEGERIDEGEKLVEGGELDGAESPPDVEILPNSSTLNPTRSKHALPLPGNLPETLPAQNDPLPTEKELTLKRRATAQLQPRHDTNASFDPTDTVALLRPIMDHQYWTRVWIIQELCFSPPYTLICVGRQKLPLSLLLAGINPFLDHAMTMPAISAARADIDTGFVLDSIRTHHAKEGIQVHIGPETDVLTMSCLGLLARSTLPTDKLYGILGLIDDTIRADVTVDYTRPLPQVCLDMTKAIIREGGIFAQLMMRKSRPTTIDIPTWAVDITQNFGFHSADPLMHCYPYDSCPLDRDVFLRRQAEEGDERTLVLAATYVDTIDGIAAYIPFPTDDPDSGFIFPSMANPKTARHAYDDDEQMLRELDDIFTSRKTFDIDADLLPPVWGIPFASSQVIQPDDPENMDWMDDTSTARAHHVKLLTEFLTGNADFQLWGYNLPSLFPKFTAEAVASDIVPTVSTPDLIHKFLDGHKYDDEAAVAMLARSLGRFQQVRLATTTKGRLARVSPLAASGDQIWAANGFEVPAVLRPNGDHFEFIGVGVVSGSRPGEEGGEEAVETIIRLR